jgi:hypothetical protein
MAITLAFGNLASQIGRRGADYLLMQLGEFAGQNDLAL